MPPPYVAGNRLTLLRSGAEYFPALEQAILAAREEVYLETYIFAGDATGERIAGALAAAARRGVRVHLIIDGFGAHDLPAELRALMERAGVRILVFRPNLSVLRFKRTRLRRMHRKLASIDGETGFVGGINVIDDMDTPRQVPPRYDYAVRVEGPLVAAIHAAAVHLWRLVSWASLRRRGRHRAVVFHEPAPAGTQRAALLVRDNLRHRADIEQAYLDAIASASSEIIIANAYFFPGVRFRHALVAASKRGVRVVLLLQGKVEYLLLHYASRALYGPLLEAGVEIHEYHKSFLHAKVAVIDGHWATVGSSNIDPFSLLLAREANIVAEDRAFAAELRESLHLALEDGAKVVVRGRWFSQPLWKRAPIWLGYGLARLLMGVFGYGHHH